MPNADKFGFEDEDNSYQVQETSLGISGVSGITKRGPINDPSNLITSEAEFIKLHGGRIPGNEFIEDCLRHLNKGGMLRVNRIAHYTDITIPSSLSATKPGPQTVTNNDAGKVAMFVINAKYEGADYNNLRVNIKNPSNSQTGFFDLEAYVLGDDYVASFEVYKNCKFSVVNNVVSAPFIQQINNASKLIRLEATGAPTNTTPFFELKTFTGGTNGGTVLPVDYIGSELGQTGFNAFDGYDDMMQIGVPTIYDTNVLNAGAEYAEARQDLMFFAHLNPELDFNVIVAARNAVTSATKYTAFFTGGLKIRDAVTGETKSISELLDVMLLADKVDSKFGPWFSISGTNRGTILDGLGAIVNFGGKGNYNKLNALANAGINAVVLKKGKTYLANNVTGQSDGVSKASYLNIVRSLIYLKKSLGPTIENYLQEPLDIPTFIKLANEVEPFLQGIKDKRGLYAFKWDGDQNVGNINDVKVNNLADIDQGIYRVKLALEPINGIGEIIVGISINKTGTISMDILDDTTGTF